MLRILRLDVSRKYNRTNNACLFLRNKVLLSVGGGGGGNSRLLLVRMCDGWLEIVTDAPSLTP